ncbi:C40 family peptidase [Acidobacteriota bacterium]
MSHVYTTKIREMMRQLKRKDINIKILYLLIFSIFFGHGCRAKIQTRPFSSPIPTGPALLGYTIQTGAFSKVDNAIKMTAALNKQGYKAFYFVHESGLLKVRMGNYSTQKKADLGAKRLLKLNVISEYFIVPPREYSFSPGRDLNEQSLRKELVASAQNFISYPYSWGGDSPEEGFDCSGLVLAVYHLNGFSLPRTSREQYRSGRFIQKNRLQIGDLVFFKTAAGTAVNHVGIYVGNDLFIHAPGRNKIIRMDSLSKPFFRERYVGACSYF